MMNKFTSGVVAGTILAAAGIGYVMNDRKAKRKVMQKGRKFASRASNMLDDIADNVF